MTAVLDLGRCPDETWQDHSLTLTYRRPLRRGFRVTYYVRCWHCDLKHGPVPRDIDLFSTYYDPSLYEPVEEEMGDVHYADKLPEHSYLCFGDKVFITERAFLRIGDYTRSQPTGPSPGRIYRKNMGWPADMNDNWFVFFCESDPDHANMVLHRPYRAIIRATPPVYVPSDRICVYPTCDEVGPTEKGHLGCKRKMYACDAHVDAVKVLPNGSVVLESSGVQLFPPEDQ